MNHKEIIEQLVEILNERKAWDVDSDSPIHQDVKALGEAIIVIAKDYVFGEPEDLHPVPEHYKVDGLEQDTMDVIEALVRHNCTDVWEACVYFSSLKYLFRYGKKDGIKGLTKAVDFIHRLKDEVER